MRALIACACLLLGCAAPAPTQAPPSHFSGGGLEFATRGTLTTIGGRRATVEWTAAVSDGCASMGGGAELIATIPTAPRNYVEMRACVAGPGLDAVRGQLDAMLASVRWLD